jgi:hypothetical protein
MSPGPVPGPRRLNEEGRNLADLGDGNVSDLPHQPERVGNPMLQEELTGTDPGDTDAGHVGDPGSLACGPVAPRAGGQPGGPGLCEVPLDIDAVGGQLRGHEHIVAAAFLRHTGLHPRDEPRRLGQPAGHHVHLGPRAVLPVTMVSTTSPPIWRFPPDPRHHCCLASRASRPVEDPEPGTWLRQAFPDLECVADDEGFAGGFVVDETSMLHHLLPGHAYPADGHDPERTARCPYADEVAMLHSRHELGCGSLPPVRASDGCR